MQEQSWGSPAHPQVRPSPHVGREEVSRGGAQVTVKPQTRSPQRWCRDRDPRSPFLSPRSTCGRVTSAHRPAVCAPGLPALGAHREKEGPRGRCLAPGDPWVLAGQRGPVSTRMAGPPGVLSSFPVERGHVRIVPHCPSWPQSPIFSPVVLWSLLF